MTPLALSALLWTVYLATFAGLATAQVGMSKTLGPRDDMRLHGLAARADRAQRNHLDSLILFTAATVALYLADRTSGLTANLGWIYLAARVAYLPAYLSGIPGLRSLVWGVGFVATLLLLVLAVLP
ncbi:MAPEG family protein [Roseobacter sp. HKCCA0434]|uniref:MAPEG family protein n=1 Tax=Roseobacter sp. HKCCA0434 TaxID=3079297 RepID=UPI002905E2DC|nr:MAPEG family protein [Roseobacter sp. HKCCA0434]